jgi:hypothetical protein
MRRTVIGWLVIAALPLACGVGAGAATTTPSPPSPSRTAAVPAEVAGRLARAGNHLAASRYWEAALAHGGTEREVLPPLIAAEIRAGRLRAALSNLRRLEQLHPTRTEIAELRQLIASMLGAGPANQRLEKRR